MIMKIKYILALICSITIYQNTQAVVLNDSIHPGKNYDKAKFRLWYSEDCKDIKGIIVLVPGSNGDGRDLVNDLLWQELARKYNFAVVGCYFTDFQHEEMNTEKYCNVKEGSGQALLDAISHLAKKSGHTEMANAPLLLWGHSAGGQFNYEFVCWKPERVIAFVVNKGGFYYSALASKQTRNVPGIFFTGQKDMESRKYIVKGIFTMNRRIGAFWTFAEEPEAGHEIGQTQNLSKIFFDEIIPLRIQNSNISDRSSILHPIPVNSGLIGDINAREYKPFSNVQESDTLNVWLPDTLFAEAWKSFIKKEIF
jgi:poly(3-hydroxybutyrate) depolymerase